METREAPKSSESELSLGVSSYVTEDLGWVSQMVRTLVQAYNPVAVLAELDIRFYIL